MLAVDECSRLPTRHPTRHDRALAPMVANRWATCRDAKRVEPCVRPWPKPSHRPALRLDGQRDETCQNRRVVPEEGQRYLASWPTIPAEALRVATLVVPCTMFVPRPSLIAARFGDG